MNKRSGFLRDEINFIIDGIKRNGLTGGEAARSAAIGALTTALAGAGIGAWIGSKKNKEGKRRIGRGAIIGGAAGALAGSVAGPLYAQIRKYLDGVKFDNSVFEKTQHKKGDKVYIGVAGSANGENESWFADEMRDRFGRSNVVMLRHVDDIAKKYNELKQKGLDVTVVGHSSGGASAGKFLRQHPEAKGYLIDPVSWFGRGVPGNAVVFTADEKTRHGLPFENTIADIGGRWNDTSDRSVVFKGSHSNRMHDIIRDYVAPGITHGDKDRIAPSYVTSEFGIGKQGSDVGWIRFSPDDFMSKQGQAPGNFLTGYEQAKNESQNLQVFADKIRTIADKIRTKLDNPVTLEDEARTSTGESDPYFYNILVGGANAGGKGFLGLSDLPFGVLSKGTNRKLFRHNQQKQIRQEIDNALKNGLHPRVVGHSWGGSAVANIAKDYPDVPFYAMDPVSWTHRIDKTPRNLTIYYPKEGDGPEPKLFTRLAPILGGRWPGNIKGEGRIRYYSGNHVDGVSDAVTGINNENMKLKEEKKPNMIPKWSDMPLGGGSIANAQPLVNIWDNVLPATGHL